MDEVENLRDIVSDVYTRNIGKFITELWTEDCPFKDSEDIPISDCDKSFIVMGLPEYKKRTKVKISRAELKYGFLHDKTRFMDKGATFGEGSEEEQKNYQYVFVTLTDDNTIAVVGKTSFWDTYLEKDKYSEDDTNSKKKKLSSALGDLFIPYLSGTSRKVLDYYSTDERKYFDLDEKLTKVIIMPINLYGWSTEELKGKKKTFVDTLAEKIESAVRAELLEQEFTIINKN